MNLKKKHNKKLKNYDKNYNIYINIFYINIIKYNKYYI